MYRIILENQAEKDILKYKMSGEKKLLKKVFLLLTELKTHPKTGTGKPEQLKHFKEPTWSRRITDKHRLVYRIQDETVTVLVISAYGHYEDK
jgi:toxin YoeB